MKNFLSFTPGSFLEETEKFLKAVTEFFPSLRFFTFLYLRSHSAEWRDARKISTASSLIPAPFHSPLATGRKEKISFLQIRGVKEHN
jgi:hypothetical protein